MPSWSAEEKIAAYAVFGHMPYYLAQVRPGESLSENILNIVLMPDGLLHEESRLLLDQELSDTSAYFSVLRAIGAGQTRVGQIATRTGISTARVSQMLELLRNLWLVERQLPVTVTNPERSKQSSYRITHPYLRFWFRFVPTAQGRRADGEGARRHLQGHVLPNHREVDTAAIDDAGKVIALGSCKWTAGQLPYSEKAKLDAIAARIQPDGPTPDLYFFARSGVDDRLQQETDSSTRLHVITPEQLFE